MHSQDLGSPSWTSALLDRIRTKGPARATAGEWLRFLLASSEHGIGLDEMKFSRIAHTLGQHGERDVLSRQQVLGAGALKALMPRLQLLVDDSFLPSDGWVQTAVLIAAKQYAKRGLFGSWPESTYVVRYRHRSLGWAICLARHNDLFVQRDHRWWLVLNSKGARAIDQPPHGFQTAPEAMAHAALLMRRLFKRSAKARHTPRWERFSLHGLGPYAELLITLPAWDGSYNSPVHFPGVHNLLVHLRTNVCDAEDGRRVLFLDEVQSDWHAALATERGPDRAESQARLLDTPFARDWPLLALKFALWWGARQGLNGVAWSTPDLHLQRWRGHDPPTEVYQRNLPDAARKLARVLPLHASTIGLLRRRVRPRDGQQWQVFSKVGVPVCRAFKTQEQANRFADLTGAIFRHELPVLWMPQGHLFDRMPLFGVGDAALWANEPRAGGQGRSASPAGADAVERDALGHNRPPRAVPETGTW